MTDRVESQASEPAQSAFPRSRVRLVERITASRVGVVLSALVYFVGYALTRNWYGRFGVPWSELQFADVVAAGVWGLAAVVLPSGVGAGGALALEFLGRVATGRPSRKAWVGIALALACGTFVAWWAAAAISHASPAFPAAIAAMAFVVTLAQRLVRSRESRTPADAEVGQVFVERPIATMLLPVGVLATMLLSLLFWPASGFHGVDSALGGAQPRWLASQTVEDGRGSCRGSTVWDRIFDELSEPPSEITCRTLYRLYESDAYLYLLVSQEEGPCPGEPSAFENEGDGWWNLQVRRDALPATLVYRQSNMEGHPCGRGRAKLRDATKTVGTSEGP